MLRFSKAFPTTLMFNMIKLCQVFRLLYHSRHLNRAVKSVVKLWHDTLFKKLIRVQELTMRKDLL